LRWVAYSHSALATLRKLPFFAVSGLALRYWMLDCASCRTMLPSARSFVAVAPGNLIAYFTVHKAKAPDAFAQRVLSWMLFNAGAPLLTWRIRSRVR